MESCSHCGKLIGDLQPAHLLDEKVYCGICHPFLLMQAEQAKQAAAAPPPIAYATPARLAMPGEAGYVMQPGDIICPNMNCRYVGPALKVARGSVPLGCLLMIVTFGIGVIYFIIKSGSDILCPRCGLHIRRE